MDKIKMTTPIVEMDGDEMTRVLWQKIKDILIYPYIDLKSEYYDLGIENRNKTDDQVSVDSADLVGQAAGDSGRTVQRYIRLTCLIPELLKLLDEGKINFTVGVSLTYLSETEQIWVKDCIVSGASSVTGSMATKLKQYSGEGKLTELAVQLILNEKKTETGKVTLTEKKIRKYFPKEYNREQIEQVIYELLDNWKKSQ